MTILDRVKADGYVQQFMESPNGACMNCAQRITVILSENNIQHRILGMLIWSGISDTMPKNHFCVISYEENFPSIIDPTAAQFRGMNPFFGTPDRWLDEIRTAMPFALIKAKEFGNLGAAQCSVGSYFIGGAMDFDGVPLNAPSWYSRILNNLDAFMALDEKMIRANERPAGYRKSVFRFFKRGR